MDGSNPDSVAHDYIFHLDRPWNRQLPRIALNALTDACFVSGWVPINRVLHESWKTTGDAEKGAAITAISAIGVAVYLALRTSNEIQQIEKERQLAAFMKGHGQALGAENPFVGEDRNYWKRMAQRARRNSQFMVQPLFQLAAATLTVPMAVKSLQHGNSQNAYILGTSIMLFVNGIGNVLYALKGSAPGALRDNTGKAKTDNFMKSAANLAKSIIGNPIAWCAASLIDVGETYRHSAVLSLPTAANTAYAFGVALAVLSALNKTERDFAEAKRELFMGRRLGGASFMLQKPEVASWLFLTAGCALAAGQQFINGAAIDGANMTLLTAMGWSIYAKEKWGGVWQWLNPRDRVVAEPAATQKAKRPEKATPFRSNKINSL